MTETPNVELKSGRGYVHLHATSKNGHPMPYCLDRTTKVHKTTRKPVTCPRCLSLLSVWAIEHTVISDRRARKLASEWHGGQWAPMYALASSGAIREDTADEIRECLRQDYDEQLTRELRDLLRYVEAKGPRGPVEGWANIGIDDVIDNDGANATASLLLNEHHDVVVSDDESYCEVCRFAIGWLQPTALSHDVYGHATQVSSTQVQGWIELREQHEEA